MHIDLIESIAIFFVILYHSILYDYNIFQNNSIIIYVRYFFMTILSTCVPLFFLVNGYLLFKKEFNLKKHIYKIIRLILLTIIWALFLMTIYMIIKNNPINIKTIIESILSLDITWSMNIFWFMGALICIYILFPALKSMFDTNKKAYIFFVITCSIFTFGYTIVNHLIILSNYNYNNIDVSFITMFNPFRGIYGYSFVYFCVGGLLYNYENKILSIKNRNIVCIIGLLICCTLLFLLGVYYTKYVDRKIYDVVWNGYDTIFTFFNCIFIYILCLNFTKNCSFITNISKNTLGIFFIHGLIIKLTQPWIKLYVFLCNFSVNIIYAISIVVICLLICFFIKKIPILKKII